MEENIKIQEIFHILRKRLLLIVSITFLSVLISGIVSYYYIAPIYESSTQLLINQKNPVQQSGSTINVRENLELVNTYRVIIKSPAILDLVKEELNLNRSIKKLSDQISVSNEQNSQVVTITVQDRDQKQAVDIANTIAEQLESKIKVFMNIDNVTIISQANEEASKEPVWPRPILNMLISFTLSFLLIIGTIFLLEYLDDTIKSEDDLQIYLELPVLGSIPVQKVRNFQQNDIRTDAANMKGVKNQWGSWNPLKGKKKKKKDN